MATRCLYYVYFNRGLRAVIEHAESMYRPDSIYLYSETTQIRSRPADRAPHRKPTACGAIKVPLMATALAVSRLWRQWVYQPLSGMPRTYSLEESEHTKHIAKNPGAEHPSGPHKSRLEPGDAG